MGSIENDIWRGDKSMVCVLVETIVHQVWFLEHSDDKTLDADTASQQLEDINASLQQLTQVERVEFIKCLEEIATEAEERQVRIAPFYDLHHKEYLEFLRTVASYMGLVDDGYDNPQ